MMAESISEVKEAAKSFGNEAIHTAVSHGDLKVEIDADSATFIKALTIASSTAITLGAMYTGYKMAEKITDVINIAISGRRDGREVQSVQGSSGLHVLLHCSTNERFLEVFRDLKSGRMKERLQLEFSFAEIKTEGLVVKIENIEEVEEKVAAINVLKM